MIKKNGVKPSFGKLFAAFSLIELMISLIIISMIAAAFTPVITKKLKANNVVANSSFSEISKDCASKFGSSCELCTKSYCIQCSLNCLSDEYINTTSCECASCSKFDNNSLSIKCEQCTSEGCSKCEGNSYLKDGICTPCPSGLICDGESASTTCPDGYYCQNGEKKSCSDKFGGYCEKCTYDKCTSCSHGYFLKQGQCQQCPSLSGCWQCVNETVCGSCDVGSYLSNGVCKKCGYNCNYCSNEKYCTQCSTGYSINKISSSEAYCESCNVENCTACDDNDVNTCIYCKTGNYLDKGRCYSCSKVTSDSNCVACDKTGCIACKPGYTLRNNACISETRSWQCNDKNFMRIGNLCVTRFNMGDRTILPIPSTVSVQDSDVVCPATACCWQGVTSSGASIALSYAPLTRTLCNGPAAKEICSKFTYANKKWRLPTYNEMQNWGYASIGLDNDGLQMCEGCSPHYSWSYCMPSFDRCVPYMNWGYENGKYFGTYYDRGAMRWASGYSDHGKFPASVRCVTEM